MACEPPPTARARQDDQLLRVAGGERQFQHALVVDHLPDARLLRLHLGDIGFHLNLLATQHLLSTRRRASGCCSPANQTPD